MNEEEIKQKALLTDEEIEGILDTWALRPDYAPYDIARVQLDKAFPIAKQIGFEIGIEQGKKEGKRELLGELWVHHKLTNRDFEYFTAELEE